MPPLDDAVTGASARSVAVAMAQRPLTRPPRASAQLSQWQALKSLCRQQWHPADADQRSLRWFGVVVSVGLHVFLAAVLAWLIYQQYLAPSHPPPKGEEMVVQIEYIGEGTVDEVGGGPASEPASQQNPSTAQVEDAAVSPAPSSTPAPVVDEPPSPEPPAAVPVPSQPVEVSEAVATVPAEATQPLTVSEPIADAYDGFVLPPTTQRLDAPELSAPQLQMSIPAIAVVDVPAPSRPSVSIIEPTPVDLPVLAQRPPDVAVREIPAPAPATPVPTKPLPRLPTTAMARPTAVAPPRELRPPTVQMREIPTVAAAPTPAISPSVAAASGSSQSAAAPAASTSQPNPPTTKPPGGADQGTVSSTAGPKEQPAAGGWASPKRGDDWGAAAQERPGKQIGQAGGLYNSDGSTKLAEALGSASPAQPPGVITDEIVNLDRSGTWLKRAPTDYEPTAFDQYWRPNENLLEEWVRKSVTTIRIPIPGTSKHIVCQTVLLALGGGCGITDPNLADQPASARPPPDIPFKPELQEGNGSLPGGD